MIHHPKEEIHSYVAVFRGWAQPDQDSARFRVYTMEYLHLLTAFVLVVLVDANIIDPQKTWLVRESEALKGQIQVYVYGECLVIALDTVPPRFSPIVGYGLVLRPPIKVIDLETALDKVLMPVSQSTSPSELTYIIRTRREL